MSPIDAAGPPLRSVLRNRNFLFLLSARVVNTAAILMQTVAIGWQMYTITGDPLYLGLVGLAEFLPSIAFALITGAVADRFERRRIMAIAFGVEALAAATVLYLTLSGLDSPWPIFAIAAAVGAGRAFAMPAGQALLANVVPPAQFPQAVAWGSSAFQVAVIASPALGGLLFIFGAGAVYATTMTLLIVSVLLTLAIKPPPRAPSKHEPTTLDTLLAGFKFVKSRQVVLGAISLDLFAVLFGGATALLPIFAKDILATGPEGLGALRSAPAIGAASMAIWLARHPLQRRVGHIMFAAVAVFGLATIVFALSSTFWLSMVALAVLGGADQISVVIRSTLVQLSTPDEMRGRVSAVNSIFIGASNQLGEFESGVTARIFGTVPAVVLGGIGTMLVTGLWMYWFPRLRQADTFSSVQQRTGDDARS